MWNLKKINPQEQEISEETESEEEEVSEQDVSQDEEQIDTQGETRRFPILYC
jgi:hypothetical protein